MERCPSCDEVIETGMEAHLEACILSRSKGIGPTPPKLRISAEKEKHTLTSSISQLPPPSPSYGDEDYARYLTQEEETRAKARKEQTNEENERLLRAFLQDESGLECCLCKTCFAPENVVKIAACGHLVCSSCLRHHVITALDAGQPCSHLPCVADGCTSTLDVSTDIHPILTPNEFERFEEAVLNELIENEPSMLRCPGCDFIVERVQHSDSVQTLEREVTDENGRLVQMSKESIEHRSQYRLRCPKCRIEFCGGCMSSPYHLGRSCNEYKVYLSERHCRFCDSTVVDNDICDSDECTEKQKFSCTAVLDCGHICHGIRDETTHLPCMYEGNGDDFCNICWVETLKQAPCVQLECGHIFHAACVKKKLKSRWTGARITFGFICCPLCSSTIRHEWLKRDMQEILELQGEIEMRAYRRLQHEKLDQDESITTVGSRYYQQPTKYAMDKFAYYMCHKCHKPYYGGQRRCEEAADDPDKEFDETELICGGCSTDTGCPVHGKEFLEYKCRWCCNIATWFCWGTSHFCTSCHRRQMKGEYLNRQPRNTLPKCPGPGKCSLATPHPEVPGDEFCIGCFLCREEEKGDNEIYV